MMDTNLHHSAAFQSFSAELVKRLVERHPLRGLTVLDIGCGQGEFLRELCQVAGCRGVGYDAMYAGPEGPDGFGAALRRGHAPLGGDLEPFDFVTSRHRLEHLDDPHQLLVRLRALAGGRPVGGYLEVPDAGHDLATAGWEVIYPHVSYFDGYSLCRLVTRARWRVTASGPLFSGMFRFVEIATGPAGTSPAAHAGSRPPTAHARSRPPTAAESWSARLPDQADRDRHLRSIAGFAARHAAERRYWRETVDPLVDRGDRPVLWGAGSRGVQFLHLADPRRRLAAVVDVNPRKWGRYLPVTGHEVWPPRALAELGSRAVIITNPAYRQEIDLALRQLGVEAELMVA